MIQIISRKIAHELGNLLQADEGHIEVYAYSMEILALLLLTLALVIVSALFLNILKPVLLFLAVFAPFRIFGGGTHLSSGRRCVLVSTCMFIAFGCLSCWVVISEHILIILISVAISLGLYATIRWVPAGTAKHPITDNRIRFIQKVNMLVSLLLYTIASFVYINAGYLMNTFALTLGAIVSLVLITPLGYQLIGAVDNTFEIMMKRR